MKKILKITGIALASILVLMVVLPIALKGKIQQVVINEANKMLNAKLDLSSVGISLFRSFPKATIDIYDFSLVGTGDFAQDTLVSAKRLSATVDIMSLFGDSGYDVWKVVVAGADVNAIVLEDGRPNWDIMKQTEETAGAEDPQELESAFRLKLRKLSFKRTNLSYDDRQGKMGAALDGLALAYSGDFTADRTALDVEMQVESTSVLYGGVALLNKAVVAADVKMDADLDAMVFNLHENVFRVNALEMAVDGMFAMPADGYDMDLTLKTEKIGFKELLSMIPAVYMSDFKGLDASGEVALGAWVKGKMHEGSYPAFEVSVDVSNGRFKYPDLPRSIDNIRIKASVANSGGSADNTVLDVSDLGFSIAGNPFSMTMHVATPISDPAFSVSAKGHINLGMIKEVYPVEGVELNGVLNADLGIKGRVSYIDKGQYDRIAASGTLSLNDMLLKMKDVPDVRIDKSQFAFTPENLRLTETKVGIGRSDITAQCVFDNYLGYVFKGETIRGEVDLSSDLLDLNELMGGASVPDVDAGEETTGVVADSTGDSTVAAGSVEVPANIDFGMNVRIGKLLFDNMDLQNVQGKVMVKGGVLNMDNLSFNTLDGSVTANGYYSTAEKDKGPLFDGSFAMNGLSFTETFRTFATVQKMMPLFESLKGNFSGRLNLNTRLDGNMGVDYSTMNGGGEITTDNVEISGIRALDMVADLVKHPELKNIRPKDLKVTFRIVNGRVDTNPFDIKIGDANLNLSGSTGIDSSIDYKGKVRLPASAGSVAQLTTLDFLIGGTFDSPNVTLDTKSMVNQAAQTLIDESKEKLLDELGKKLGVDISDAEKQRDVLVAEARKAGEKLVEVAEDQAAKLVEGAGSNILAKVAAQKAGEKLVQEARKQAAALETKAATEGDKLVEKAKGAE